MAVDSRDPITGHPIFDPLKAPDTAVDPTEVAKYAAEVGNRIVRDNLAGLNAYPYARAGLWGDARDTGYQYRHNGTGWVLSGGATPLVVLRRTTQALQSGNNAYGNITSAAGGAAAWTAADIRGLTFDATGIAITVPGLYEVSWVLWATGTGAGLVGIGVNATAAPGAEKLHALNHIMHRVSSLGSSSGFVRLAAGDKLSLWAYGDGGAMTIRAAAAPPEGTHWGARWIAP